MAHHIDLDGKIEWTDIAVHIKDFADRYTVPNIAKVVKGQYKDVGVAKSVQSELYVHSIQTSQKVLAEGIKVKEGKRAIVIGNHKYSLPLSYQGWFELLSQDGKAVKAITSVQELSRAFPTSCIVRENFKAFIARESGELTLDKYRILQGGEQLNLVGEIWVTVNTNKGIVKRRLLQCLDIKGESVYLGIEQKGLFSPIAGQTNISGVHSLRGLLEKFRFPILVRLVHGIIPSKLEKNFTGVFRLNGVYSEESIFVCPLKKDAKMVPISTREPLKVIAAANLEELQSTEGFKYHTERCNKMITSYMNSIHLLFTMPDPNAVKAKKIDTLRSKMSEKTISPEVIEENILFEEVEDIYAYVREGGPTPPPPRPRPLPGAVAMLQKSKKRQIATKKAMKDEPSDDKSPSPPTVSSPSPHSPPVVQSSSPRASPNSPPVVQSSSPRTSPHSPAIQSPSAVPPLVTSKSPIASPSSPVLSPQFIPTKDDFWEEPIYEPLDKIRTNKNGSKKEERIPAPLPLPEVPPDYDDYDDEPPSTAAFTEVQNLRQVYKQSMDGPAPRVSDEDIEEIQEMLEDINPPPIPPKKYTEHDTGLKKYSEHDTGLKKYSEHDTGLKKYSEHDTGLKKYSDPETESSATSDEDPVVMQTTIPTSPEPTVTVHTPLISYAPTHPVISHNGYHTKVLLNRPKDPHEKQLLNNRGGNNSRSSVAYARGGPVVSSANRVSVVRSHAPYVAVARVGDTEMFDNRRRKMHSMYL